MNFIVFSIIILQLIIIIILCLSVFREQFLTFRLGIRRKTAIFVDLRDKKRVTLSEDLTSFEYKEKTYIWNSEKEKNGACIYNSKNVEPLEVALDSSKCMYWCDSSEYHTNLKNKLLETLMMLKSKDQIIKLLAIAVFLIVVVAGLVYLRTEALLEQSENIRSAISSLNQTTEIIEVK